MLEFYKLKPKKKLQVADKIFKYATKFWTSGNLAKKNAFVLNLFLTDFSTNSFKILDIEWSFKYFLWFIISFSTYISYTGSQKACRSNGFLRLKLVNIPQNWSNKRRNWVLGRVENQCVSAADGQIVPSVPPRALITVYAEHVHFAYVFIELACTNWLINV